MNYSVPLEEVLPCLCLQVGAALGAAGTQREVGRCHHLSGASWV